MYRVLLPDGELTVSARIIVLHCEVDKKGKYRCQDVGLYETGKCEPNGLYVVLSEPYTSHYGFLYDFKDPEEIRSIIKQMLETGFYDFTGKVTDPDCYMPKSDIVELLSKGL